MSWTAPAPPPLSDWMAQWRPTAPWASANDITVVRVVGRFGFGFLYPSAVAPIKDVA